MSIPKEPRQLMINLMYLVLTALLALNVSAEVMNAFFSLEKSMKTSSKIVDDINSSIYANIKKEAEAYKGDSLKQEVMRKAEIATQISDDFDNYMNGVYQRIFDAAGGENPDKPGTPKDKKNKDITTQMLVNGPDNKLGGVPGLGDSIQQKILETRAAFLELIDEKDKEALEIAMPLGKELVDDAWKANMKAKKGKKVKENATWSYYKFNQMPVAAVIPLIRSFQADDKTTASAVLNNLFKKVKGENIVFDAFFPVAAAKKGYVIEGEEYEADIFLSAFSTAASESTKIYVNGNQLEMEEGKATYTSRASGIGPRKYNVKIDVTNPLTGETESYDKEFEYEVGRRSVAVAADKMNVFYIGVDNPVSISAAGVSSNDLRVSMSGAGSASIKKSGKGYVVKASKPTPVNQFAYVNVTGGGLSQKVAFRVKRIPDPVARLGNKNGGRLGNGTFKAQKGLIAWLDNFDFEAKCNIQGFEVVKVPKRQDAIIKQNKGGSFGSEAKRLVSSAKPGDMFIFRNVKAKCPGDVTGRPINDLTFTIN